MKIAIDLRSLQNGSISGVENYILNLLEYLIPANPGNSFTLFTNSYRANDFGHLKFINTTTVAGRIPNRLLNLSLKALNYPKFENLFGDFDCLFLPNFNQFAIHPKTKLVITVHDLSPIVTPEFYDSRRRLWHLFINIKKSLHRANHILAVSEFTKKELIRIYGLSENKITVTHLGVQPNLFRPNLADEKLRRVRNIYGLPGSFYLFIATLEPRKNISNLIKAFEQQTNDVDLVIAGREGWKYSTILEQIAQSPKRHRIRYIGYVEEEHKPYLLKLAQALVWPSFYEGFGLPPLEAMAVGTPVITSQVTALPETVGSAAIMVDPYSVTDLAQAMAVVASDAALRADLVARGHVQAKKFTWQATAEKTLGVFNNLAK
jgi:glycosyltransferase involved in cell wall biosynthesis